LQGSPTKIVTRGAFAAVVALAATPAGALAGVLTPESPASPNASDSQLAYIVMVTLGTVIALAMIAGLIGAVRGRRSKEATAEAALRRTRGTNTAQRRVGLALGGLALIIFIFGIVMTESARKVEATGPDGLTTAQNSLELPSGSEPLEITVSGQQWLWRFEYPDGTFSYTEMVVPVDTEVVLNIESTDILHRWWIPALGGQFDAVPGQTNHTWFKADEVGVYEGQSTQFSGPAYAQMRAFVNVVEPSEYEAWLVEQADDIKAAQTNVADTVAAASDPDAPADAGSEVPSPGSGEEPDATETSESETQIGAGDPAGVGEGEEAAE
jgi:cytochrome c oxidase subunit 2